MSSRCPIAVWMAYASFLLSTGPLRAAGAAAQVITDPPADAVIRVTDDDGDGPCNPNTQGLPDLAQMKLGRFAPTAPDVDLFAGKWSVGGGFLRFDVIFSGLVNPPGPLGFDFEYPVYAPFQYGTNPVFGWIELDMDQDEDTGGELSTPQFRYLGNVARFGGKPQGSRFTDRVAEDDSAFDDNVLTPPYADRSGEEFHLTFIAEDIDAITILQEKPNGDPAIFEEGEVWSVEGTVFHRAHGFRDFAFMCPWWDGEYMPTVFLRFAHDLPSDRTTVSLVYPLTNAACAKTIGPSTPAEGNDGCTDNQNSVEEALTDLKFSATNASALDRLNPDFQLIADWEFKTVSNHLWPAAWRLEALVGTAYEYQQLDYSLYIWTDVWPNPKKGDFNGDGIVNGSDAAFFNNYLESHDGLPGCDDDGNPSNGRITLHDFASNFSLYDTNHDGIVQINDSYLMGDMNLDGTLGFADLDDFVQGLIDPAAYQSSHQGVDPQSRGDMNRDNRLDGLDTADFLDALLLNGGA